MPKRNTTKCTPKGMGPTITMPVEANLTRGDAWSCWDFTSIAEFRDAWSSFGPIVTERWCKSVPGSRPMAAYVTGEIPPWSWTHPTPCLRHPLRRIDGVALVLDTAGHTTEHEFHHLVELGVIDADERRLALARLASPERVDYRPIWRDAA